MTAVKDSKLYKTLKKAVRKEDHAELLRMLEMVGPIRNHENLYLAFSWASSPQGYVYWEELSDRLEEAGHDCY